MAPLQGVDRALRALEVISQSPQGVTVAEIATQIGSDRAIAYRIVETLEQHALVTRADEKRVRLSAGAVALASRFQQQLVQAAEPVLQDLADATRLYAFLSIAHGTEECVAVLGVEPTADRVAVRVTHRIGTRHLLTRGAPGIAILALHPPQPGEPDTVKWARASGYSITTGELQSGAIGLAAGFEVPGLLGASVGVVAMGDLDSEHLSHSVREAAAKLASLSAA